MWQKHLTLSDEARHFGERVMAQMPIGAETWVEADVKEVGCACLQARKACQWLGGSEELGVGILYIAPNTSEIAGVVLTGGFAIQEGAWSGRAAELSTLAHVLLGDVMSHLGVSHSREPLFMFDMTATIYETAFMTAESQVPRALLYSRFEGDNLNAVRFAVVGLDKFLDFADHSFGRAA